MAAEHVKQYGPYYVIRLLSVRGSIRVSQLQLLNKEFLMDTQTLYKSRLGPWLQNCYGRLCYSGKDLRMLSRILSRALALWM